MSQSDASFVNGDMNDSYKSKMPAGPVLTEEAVAGFLRSRPDFFEKYVMEELELETLERWIIRKTQRDKKRSGTAGRKTSLSRWKMFNNMMADSKLSGNGVDLQYPPSPETRVDWRRGRETPTYRFCVHADKRQMLQDLTHSLQLRPSMTHVLSELGTCISSAVSADGHRLYLPEHGDQSSLCLYLGGPLLEDNDWETRTVGKTTVAGLVARTKEPIRLSKGDPAFPKGLDELENLLLVPVVQPDGQLAAVLEMWRTGVKFHEEDEEIASSYLVWGGIALHYARLYLTMAKQRKLSDFLLAVVKSIFQDMVSMDSLVTKIMNFAQRLTDADRASLFLLDSKNKELFARIFDVGGTGGGDSDSEGRATPPAEIRVSKGIAGQVARTGEVLNIADAYSDPRFNRTVDKITGYQTKTILCMPIFIRGAVIGVMQMVNKHNGPFNKEDEEAFETFAVYCGLALHHAKLYDKIRRSEQKYRVALEVLGYHSTCEETEVERAKELLPGETVIGLDDFHFNVFTLDDEAKARRAVLMFKDLFGLARFDRDCLIRFVLTVKKNYRRVPYHNWSHGFSVANSMYAIIKHSNGTFSTNECLSLYIGALCHDLDHRGKNNKFMLETESPLAAIYSTSTMEHHHFNQTVTILQQTGHNIFSQLTNSEYKQVLSHIKHCILATDLARFFPYRARLQQVLADSSFSWANPEHRSLIQAICMTASDLSASAKPWELQVKTAEVIFQEFYEQGDAERAAGITPIPMMDRNQPDQQAASQVGFLTGICIPCYGLLAELIPDTSPLLDQCRANLERWKVKNQLIGKEVVLVQPDPILLPEAIVPKPLEEN